MGSEEKGGKKEGRNRQNRPFWEDKWGVTHTCRRSRSRSRRVPPPPPFIAPNFALEGRMRGLASVLSVVTTLKRRRKDEEGFGLRRKDEEEVG
jgi:hypothetical protein